MTGIEKITARIQEDAQQEIDAVLAEAKAQADGIAARYAGQAKQATAEILEKGERSAEECRLLAQLAVRASVSGSEQLIFPAADRARYGVKVATKANEILKKAGKPAALTLSEETRAFQGGLLVCDGDVEVNCTFETLVRLARSEVVGEVTAVLFA